MALTGQQSKIPPQYRPSGASLTQSGAFGRAAEDPVGDVDRKAKQARLTLDMQSMNATESTVGGRRVSGYWAPRVQAEHEVKEKRKTEEKFARDMARRALDQRLKELDAEYARLLEERKQIEARMYKTADGKIDWARYGQENGIERKAGESDSAYETRVQRELKSKYERKDLHPSVLTDYFHNDAQIQQNRQDRHATEKLRDRLDSDDAFTASHGRFVDPQIEAMAVAREKRTGVRINRDNPAPADIEGMVTENIEERRARYARIVELQRDGASDVTELREMRQRDQQVASDDENVGKFFRDYARIQNESDPNKRYQLTKALVEGASEEVRVAIYANEDTRHLLDENLKFRETAVGSPQSTALVSAPQGAPVIKTI